ncbi:hypothetical protein JTB14_002803 [Gonioctena quinquepunctata]|nr:hypothetical protein JTB14_002803 [Gonioctena quinquepunctata]
MKAADCYNKNFKLFPKCLPDDVEAIELTFNRIRKLTRSDLSQFSDLQLLYLQDNLIVKLDDDVFTDLHSVFALDLSINEITKVPVSIFKMPSLATLYLSKNSNMNIIDALETAKPIASPLQKVDISFTTDEENITEFPDFGPLPSLIQLNITGNKYIIMKLKNFVGFCSLEVLLNDNVTTGFEKACDCWRINRWMNVSGVKFTPFACSVEESECPLGKLNVEESAVYNQCKNIIDTANKQRQILKVSVGVGVVVIILVLLVIFYYWITKKKRGKQPVTKKGVKEPPDNHSLLKETKKAVPNEYV